MYKVKNMDVPESVLSKWNEKFLPEFDLFYFRDIDTATKLLSNDIFITSRNEFSDDRQLNTLDTLTTFSPWHVSREAEYIAIVPNEFFLTLDKTIRHQVIEEQWRLDRGQLWEKQWIQTILKKVDDSTKKVAENILEQSTYMISNTEIISFHRQQWDLLPIDIQYLFLVHIADGYVSAPSIWNELSEDQQDKMKQIHPHLVPYFNRFPEKNGPNCFAAALSCISVNQMRNRWIISQWIQQGALLTGLHLQGYELFTETSSVSTELVKEGDVLIWKNSDQVPIHASYSLGDSLVFNKDGQTMFNPWQVVRLSDVLMSWEGNITIAIYRKS
jgi:hypothetical protein